MISEKIDHLLENALDLDCKDLCPASCEFVGKSVRLCLSASTLQVGDAESINT